ncbi:MAG: hypothetical protein KatS3mg009_1124 [Acidimicrobiia bacterium]|nr:MAG: hypothetical protein KatS3mg009_1124 [Acidimicrobiia bacterium]
MPVGDDGRPDPRGAGEHDSTVVHAPGVLVRRTPWSVVALGPDAPEAVVLRDGAVEVWDAFATPARVADVAARVATARGATVAAVSGEVVEAVRRLVGAGVLHVVTDGAR